MARDFKLHLRDGVWYLSGDLTADTDLGPLAGEKEHLKLNLRNLGEVNSVGVRSLCVFMRNFQGGTFEYLECQPNFIDIVNMVPMLLKAGTSTGSVSSINIPYACTRCNYEQNILTDTSEIRLFKDRLTLPIYDCSHCNCERTFEPAMPPQDLLYFLTEQKA